jgi:mono/diheme cytochrome c family protein
MIRNHIVFCALFALGVVWQSGFVFANTAGRNLFQGYDTFSNGRNATNTSLPESFTACANCHGRSGAGSAEGGILAPSVKWSSLYQPRETMSAYASEAEISAAITRGRGRGGRTLSSAMPRFSLSSDEERNLLSYLKVVGTPDDLPRGVTATRIRFGTLLPLTGPLAAAGQAARDGLQTVFNRVNTSSGVFGRSLELVVVDSAQSIAPKADQLKKAEVYALVGGLWQTDSGALERSLSENHISAIASFSADTPAMRTGAWNFPLLAPKDQQMKILLEELQSCPAGEPIWLLQEGQIEAASRHPNIRIFTTLAALNDALLTAKQGGCLGFSIGRANQINTALTAPWEKFVVLPFPAQMLDAHQDIWREIGEASAEIAVELLSVAGQSLHEQSLLDHLADLRGFFPRKDVQIIFRGQIKSAFAPEVLRFSDQDNDRE